MNYIADKSYLAIKKETTEATAVRPTVFLPLESADIKTILNNAPDRRMHGNDFESIDLSQGERSHEGKIKVWADPDTLGYILDMFVKKGSSTGSAGAGYTHPFTVENPNTYTIEIPKGNYAQRFFGVKGDELNLIFEEAKLKAEMDVKAQGQFSAAVIRDAITGGAGAVLSLKQDYDLEPTRGLVAGDVIVIGAGTATEEEKTITSIGANGTDITFTASIASNHSIGDVCYLKAQTISYATLQKPFYFGDVLVGFGADESAAATAAASKTTATPVHELAIKFQNNLLAAPTTNYRDPIKLLPQVKACELTIKQLFSNPDQHVKWLNLVKQGMCIIMRGRMINTGTPTYNKFTFALHNAKLGDNAEPLNVGEYIMDEQTFKAAYDTGDAKALTIELVNETATY